MSGTGRPRMARASDWKSPASPVAKRQWWYTGSSTGSMSGAERPRRTLRRLPAVTSARARRAGPASNVGTTHARYSVCCAEQPAADQRGDRLRAGSPASARSALDRGVARAPVSWACAHAQLSSRSGSFDVGLGRRADPQHRQGAAAAAGRGARPAAGGRRRGTARAAAAPPTLAAGVNSHGRLGSSNSSERADSSDSNVRVPGAGSVRMICCGASAGHVAGAHEPDRHRHRLAAVDATAAVVVTSLAGCASRTSGGRSAAPPRPTHGRNTSVGSTHGRRQRSLRRGASGEHWLGVPFGYCPVRVAARPAAPIRMPASNTCGGSGLAGAGARSPVAPRQRRRARSRSRCSRTGDGTAAATSVR